MINENKNALDAWAILIQDAQVKRKIGKISTFLFFVEKEKKIAESREFFELLVAQFPTCGKFWKIYIEAEVKRDETFSIETSIDFASR